MVGAGFGVGGLEGGAAAATARGVGVLDAESRSREVVAIVDRRSIEKMPALLGHDHLHPIALHHFIAGLRVIEAHAILQSRASAVLDVDTQTLGLVVLLAQHDLKLPDCRFSDLNHQKRG